MVLVGVVLALCALWLWRLQRVVRFKAQVLGLVFRASEQDWRQGRSGYWRVQTWDSVPEVRMMVRFWRPLRVEEWWHDTGFVALAPKPRPSHLRAVN